MMASPGEEGDEEEEDEEEEEEVGRGGLKSDGPPSEVRTMLKTASRRHGNGKKGAKSITIPSIEYPVSSNMCGGWGREGVGVHV